MRQERHLRSIMARRSRWGRFFRVTQFDLDEPATLPRDDMRSIRGNRISMIFQNR